MLLIESIETINGFSTGKLALLDEYLIMKGAISVKEANELKGLVVKEANETLAKLKEKFGKAKDSVKAGYEKTYASLKAQRDKAKKLGDSEKVLKIKNKMKELRAATAKKLADLNASFKAAKDSVIKYGRAKASNISAATKKVPKSGKIAAGAAVVGGASYAGYRAYKNRKNALGK